MKYSQQEFTKNKAVALAGADGFENNLTSNHTAATATKQSAKPMKWKTTLAKLLEGPKHRFHAELWGDHCLHTCVSVLLRNHGVVCKSEWAEVQTRFGTTCRVKMYWVHEASRPRALALIAPASRPVVEGGAP